MDGRRGAEAVETLREAAVAPQRQGGRGWRLLEEGFLPVLGDMLICLGHELTAGLCPQLQPGA